MSRVKVFAVGVLCVSAAWLCGADSNSGGRTDSDVVLAEINGVKLTLSEMERTRPASLFAARLNYFESERKAVESYVDDYLLQQQAKKENVTVEELLKRHVDDAIAKDPSEEALRVYYEGVETTEPYEAVRQRIVDALRDRRKAKAKTAYMDSLRKQAKISVLVVSPRAPISMQDTPVRGSKSARVTLVEFADYECPYCQQIEPTVDKLLAEYKGEVAFAYKDFPLDAHANAQKAAEAAHCAAAQGKFWDYHTRLYASKQLDIPSLKAQAKDLGMDASAFDKCLDQGQQAGAVKASLAEAQALSLQGTPTFFVNGRYVTGSLTYERIRSVIEEELNAGRAQTASVPSGQQSVRRLQ